MRHRHLSSSDDDILALHKFLLTWIQSVVGVSVSLVCLLHIYYIGASMDILFVIDCGFGSFCTEQVSSDICTCVCSGLSIQSKYILLPVTVLKCL